MAMKTIALTKGMVAIIDDEDFNLVSKFRWIYSHGHAIRKKTEGGRTQQIPLPALNKSGAIGVHFHKLAKKWTAYIPINGKPKHIGCFDKFEDAVSARKSAEQSIKK